MYLLKKTNMNKKITITEEDLVTMIKSIIQERKEVKEQSDKKKIKTILIYLLQFRWNRRPLE